MKTLYWILSYFIATTLFLWTNIGYADRSLPEFKSAIMDSYVYLYPLVLMDVTKRVMTNVSEAGTDRRAPINQFSHAAEFPTPNYHDFVRPNVDTLYSFAWLDLTEEPMVLSVPDTHNRYYLMPILDTWTEVFASPGARTTGTQPGHFIILGPDWQGEIPDNMQVIHAPTTFVWIMGRTLTHNIEDYENVHQIQREYKITPLSQWGKDYIPPSHLPVDPTIDMSTPAQQVKNMNAEIFFKTAATMLKNNPPHKEDQDILKKLIMIGITPGQDFDITKFNKKEQIELNSSVKEAYLKIRLAAKKLPDYKNGWMVYRTGSYGVAYLNRASIALAGLGANLPEDAIYPSATRDYQGNILRGANRYRIHFAANEIPKVKGFWSITVYGRGGYLDANIINRHSIGDRDHLSTNQDGSLDIYIQHHSPGADKESNWLPTPDGIFSLSMRLYWPEKEIVEWQWLPPAILKY